MIEHDPWVGPLYESEGVDGQRLGIIGYSSWVEPDRVDYTIYSIERVVAGDWNVRFYNDIASYFRMDRAAFYNRVVMFEFVPCAIGGKDQKYDLASPEWTAAGRARTLRIAEEKGIEKLIFFSSKAWRSMPPTIERAEGRRTVLPGTKFEVGRYRLGDRHVTAIGLRHPQYAPRALMSAAIEKALALPTS